MILSLLYSKVHTDIGLLTIIPVTTVPQLQMLHPDNFEWIDGTELYVPMLQMVVATRLLTAIIRSTTTNLAEPLSTTKNEVIVFCGEMMERLTMYYYRAVMHRVHVQPTLLSDSMPGVDDSQS